MNGATFRILARYIVGIAGGYLAAIGVDEGIAKEFGKDPEVIDAVAWIITIGSSAAVELFYAAAKKYGWKT